MRVHSCICTYMFGRPIIEYSDVKRMLMLQKAFSEVCLCVHICTYVWSFYHRVFRCQENVVAAEGLLLGVFTCVHSCICTCMFDRSIIEDPKYVYMCVCVCVCVCVSYTEMIERPHILIQQNNEYVLDDLLV